MLSTCDNGAYVLVHSSTATCDAKSPSPGFSVFQLPVGDSSCVGGVYSTSGSFCKIKDGDVAICIRLNAAKPVESAIFYQDHVCRGMYFEPPVRKYATHWNLCRVTLWSEDKKQRTRANDNTKSILVGAGVMVKVNQHCTNGCRKGRSYYWRNDTKEPVYHRVYLRDPSYVVVYPSIYQSISSSSVVSFGALTSMSNAPPILFRFCLK